MHNSIIFSFIMFYSIPLCLGEPNNPSERLYDSIHFAENGIIVELDKIKSLLDDGANPNWINTKNEKHFSVLYRYVDRASYSDDPNTYRAGVEAITSLFKYGAKLQYCDKTILFSPIANGKYEITKILLENDASATARIEGMTPIEWAAHYGSEKVYNLLIEYGAKPLTKTKKSLYHFIFLAGDADVRNIGKMNILLKEGFGINDKNSRDEGAITEAANLFLCDADRYFIVNYLIEKGVDINRSYKVNDVFQTALHTAVYSSHFALCRDVSKYENAEAKEKIKDQQFFCIKVLEELIKAGAHVSARDEYERTPLHIAAKYNNYIAAEILIKAGAKLMDKDKDGKTPLDYAESAEMIKLLKGAGAKEIP